MNGEPTNKPTNTWSTSLLKYTMMKSGIRENEQPHKKK